jgi:chromosomal replication initiator protein
VTEGLTPVQLQAKQLWQAVLGDMQVRLSKNAFENWLRPTSLVAFENDVATIAAPNTFGATTLESRYSVEIAKVLSDIIGRPVKVRFTVGTDEDENDDESSSERDLAPESPRSSRGPSPAPANGVQPAGRRSGGAHAGRGREGTTSSRQLELSSAPPIGLNPRYVYESYVVGKSNMFAHAASLAVAEHPGEQYNPLYIYGDVGLGKTHLLHAIGHRALSMKPEIRVVYVSSEKFTNDLIDSIRAQRMDDFRSRYRTIDLLMIDDIQFIGGKDSTQEEFFHTFNTLYQSGRQLVISRPSPLPLRRRADRRRPTARLRNAHGHPAHQGRRAGR